MKNYSKYSLNKLNDLSDFGNASFDDIWNSLIDNLKTSRDIKLCKKTVSFMLSNMNEKISRDDLNLIAKIQDQ